MNLVLLLAFGIGLVAGLRSLTAPAVVAWAAHLGWLHLRRLQACLHVIDDRRRGFLLLAIFELIVDKLPTTPRRTALVRCWPDLFPVAFAAHVWACRLTSR